MVGESCWSLAAVCQKNDFPCEVDVDTMSDAGIHILCVDVVQLLQVEYIQYSVGMLLFYCSG